MNLAEVFNQFGSNIRTDTVTVSTHQLGVQIGNLYRGEPDLWVVTHVSLFSEGVSEVKLRKLTSGEAVAYEVHSS